MVVEGDRSFEVEGLDFVQQFSLLLHIRGDGGDVEVGGSDGDDDHDLNHELHQLEYQHLQLDGVFVLLWPKIDHHLN